MMNIEENIEQIREQFDLLKYWNYLNAGDQMIPGNYWLKAVRDFFDFQERGRMEDIPVADIATHPFLIPAFYECIERSAALIHADKEEVTNIYRPIQTANMILNDMMEWKKGDNIVFTDLCYPSFPFIFIELKKRYGVELRIVKNVNGEILYHDLEKNIDDHTKLVSINRTTAFCGFTFDVKRVCKIAHKHGALVMDDAFQALGAIDIDVHADEIDFLVSGSYKWQCGPEGAGLFYIRKSLIKKFDPKFRNYLYADIPTEIPFSLPNHDNVKSWDFPLIETANKFSQDVCTGASLFGWNAALKFIEQIGISNIEKRIKYLGGYLINRLQEIGCTVETPVEADKRHGLIVYTNGSYEKDLKTFNTFNNPPIGQKPVKVSLRALGGIGGIRVCTHYFNTEEDIDNLIDTQRKIKFN